MATPPNHRNPAGNPLPPGFMGQGFVQPNTNISANSSQQIQMQMQMQIQTQMFQMQQQMSTQAHGCNCHGPFALPNNGNCGANGGNSQPHPNSANTHMSFPSNQMPHLNPIPVPGISLSGPLQNPSPDQAPTNQTVVLGIPVPNGGFGSGQLPHFQTHMQPNSLHSPAPGQGANIPMLSSPLGPGRPPHFHTHFHPNSMHMSNNNNMHVVGQQYTMLQQQLVAAAVRMHNSSCLQTLSCVQSCHNGFPPGASFPSLQANNQQTVPPQGSNPSLSTHTNSSSSSMPPVPSYPSPMPMNNGPVANGSIPRMLTPFAQPNTVEHAQCQGQMPNLLISSHRMRPLIHSPPLPPGQRPPHLATAHFPSPLEQAAQTVTSLPFMGQNFVETSQKAAAHSAGNPSFEVGGSIPLHKNQQQLQQDQQNMQPSKHQTLEGCSDVQDRTIKEPHITNDIHQHQTGICDRGYPPRIGSGRWSSQNGRTGSGEFRFNTSEQAGGRAKKGSPMAQFPPSRVFDNGSSRFSKKSAGCTRSYASALTCKSCDHSFTNRFQMERHFKGHVKCEEKDCSFEASGKILKEHKLTHHEKQSVQSVVPPKLPKFEESIEEIQQWIDERKRNYPTEANVKRKVQQVHERRARGELMDDDAKKRRQRMREILAKQRELGVLVAEVPSHYINDGQYNHKGNCKKGSWQHDDNLGKSNLSANSARKVPRVRDLTSPRSVLNHANSLNVEQPAEGKTGISASEIPCSEGNLLSETPEKVDKDCKTEESAPQDAIKTRDIDVQHAEDNKSEKSQKICKYFQRGYCRRESRCTYLHIRQSNKTHEKTTVTSDPPKREPTLLEKLLAGEIKKEKSHLLQIFRFMVNNSFFTEWPNKPLNFFQFSGKALHIDSEQAEREYLSYLDTLYGIGEGDAEVDGVNAIKDLMESCRNDHEADLYEVDGIKNASVGRMECSRGDDFEADLDQKKVAEIERRRDDLEEGEIEEGEIV